MIFTRRQFTALAVASLASPAFADPPQTQPAGRDLNFQINDEFGPARTSDIEAVLRSAADSVWKHCPNTRWEEPGFYIFRSRLFPITLDAHRPDGRIAIGLNSSGNLWSQFTYQFAHEFCHALAGHSNDWRKLWIKQPKTNHWLEESLCATSSLFALRAMGQSWRTDPPYPNWKDYAPHLTEYAANRLSTSTEDLAGRPFPDWFRENQAAMRKNSIDRPKNNIVAMQLLPLFEANPAGWESVTYYNLAKRDPQKTLASQFSDWKSNVPAEQEKFVTQVAGLFGL